MVAVLWLVDQVTVCFVIQTEIHLANNNYARTALILGPSTATCDIGPLLTGNQFSVQSLQLSTFQQITFLRQHFSNQGTRNLVHVQNDVVEVAPS